MDPTVFYPFTYMHVPPLLLAVVMIFGGMMPFFDAEYAILELGLPKKVATSKPAQAVMVFLSTRVTAIGLLLLVFWLRKDFLAVDTILVTLWLGGLDGWIRLLAEQDAKEGSL